MIGKNGFLLFLSSYYDKLALVVALALLAFAAVNFVSGKSKFEKAEDSWKVEIDRVKSKESVFTAYVDMTPYSNALTRIDRPSLIANETNRTYGFFVPELRIWCAKNSCRYPISPDAVACPKCGTKQTGEKVAVLNADTDGDGMPDDWERKYGLDPQKNDAGDDLDGDGFTNLEEFLAGTDPSDPKSHGSLVTELRVRGIEVTYLPLFFTSKATSPDGSPVYILEYADCDQASGKWTTYTVSLKEGEFVEYKPKGINKQKIKTAYKLISGLTKKEEVAFGKGTRMDDVEYVTVERDGQKFELKKKTRVADTNYKVTLAQSRTGAEIIINGNETFEVDGETWKIINVDKKANSVVIKNKAGSKAITVKQ